MTEVSNAGPCKKPFLKRGEGTTRRVYAFKYRDEAKKKREENQMAAMERAISRRSNAIVATPDLIPPPRITRHASTNAERLLDNTVFDAKTDQQSFLDITHEVQDFNFKLERQGERQRTEFGLVDGSCRVETQTDEGIHVEDTVVHMEAKGERQDAWLESQRRHEEAQWEEAMELREFESLERRIVEETRSKLEKAEDVFRKKHVTFQDLPQKATLSPHSEGAKITKNRSVVCHGERQTPKDRVQNKESVQRVKSLRIKRQEKLRDSARTPCSEGVEKPSIGRRSTPKSQSSETQMPSPLENAMSQFEAMKTEEMKKIKRERRVLEQQSKALLKLPNKKERSEIESLEAILETERKESRSKEARHKLTVERLRDHIQQLQVENKELREEVKWHEEMQLKGGSQKRECRSVMTSPLPVFDVATQTDAAQYNTLLDEDISYPDRFGDKWALRMENPFYSETSTQESLSKADAVPTTMARASGKEEVSTFEQMPSVPSRFPDCTHSAIQHLDHPPRIGSRMEGALGTDNGYGANTLDAGCGRGCSFGGQQMSWIPSYSYPGYFPPSIAQHTMPCHPMPSYTFQPMPPLTTDNVFGYPFTNFSGEGVSYEGRAGCVSDWKQGAVTPDIQHPLRMPSTYPMMDAAPSLLPSSYTAESPSVIPHPKTNMTAPLAHQELGVSLDKAPTKTVHVKATLSADNGQSNIPTTTRLQDSRTQNPSSASKPSPISQCYVQETKKKLITMDQSMADPTVATFDNGTIKQSYADERVVVWFGNSDVKHVHPCGRVEYLYADLNTWQVTHSNNIDVFYFDIGQVEAHKPNGDKDIVFPDGTVRTVFADGSVV